VSCSEINNLGRFWRLPLRHNVGSGRRREFLKCTHRAGAFHFLMTILAYTQTARRD
jgi:hypothetical protein